MFMVKNDLNSKKSPGYDFITGRIIKELPRKGIVPVSYTHLDVYKRQTLPLRQNGLKSAQLPLYINYHICILIFKVIYL